MSIKFLEKFYQIFSNISIHHLIDQFLLFISEYKKLFTPVIYLIQSIIKDFDVKYALS